MLSVLRFVGMVNAAVWFGAAVFFTFAVGPAFFSDEMKQLLSIPYAGAAAQVVLKRYFILQNWCGAIALVHFVAELLYTGRQFDRLMFGILLSLFCFGLLGGYWLLPKMQKLHSVKYSSRATPAMKDDASRAFSAWHGVSQTMNLLMLGGLSYYFWRMANSRPASPNFRKLNVGWQ